MLSNILEVTSQFFSLITMPYLEIPIVASSKLIAAIL